MTEFLSTAVKELLERGEVEKANILLGFPYYMEGVVLHGNAIGGKFGYPTANITPPGFLPKPGVYKTVTRVGDKAYKGLTNVGSKPTFGIDTPSVETTLLDFDGNLYGKFIKVEFLRYIRPLKKFKGGKELGEQIKKDFIEAAKD